MKSVITVIHFMVFMCVFELVDAQNWSQLYNIPLKASIRENPAQITIQWEYQADAVRYFVYRKQRDAKSWGLAIATYPPDSLRYIDRNVEVGKAYEYRVTKTGNTLSSNGYIYAGIKYTPDLIKPTVLLLVESRVSNALKPEITRLTEDLTRENWKVVQRDIVPNINNVPSVKNIINAVVKTNKSLSTIFIIGHVAVPYSGNANWDGHTEHAGAWPADGYYADLDGVWTDSTVNNTTPARAENKNIPKDGKFDASQYPSDLELEIGRVDFFNMPVFGVSDTVMLRRYLDKNHEFRIGNIKAKRRALVQDNFNIQAEGFGQSGFRSYIPMFGSSNVYTDPFRESLVNGSYLCAYGAGGGSYNSCAGISNSTEMAKDSLQAIFTFLFGSYFGDWDNQNNFLRSALGSGTILATAWAGRPAMQIHQMALGERLGLSMKHSQNNNATYFIGATGARGCHIALMGDPTLTLLPIRAPSNLSITKFQEIINIRWTASPDSKSHAVFRKTLSDSAYTLMAIVDTSYFQDKCLLKDTVFEYQIKAVVLEQTASGSFYNFSQGISDQVRVTVDNYLKSEFLATNDFEFVVLHSRTPKAQSISWQINGAAIGSDTLFQTALPCPRDSSTICLIANGICNNDTSCTVLKNYPCSVPNIVKSRIESVRCFGDPTSIFLDSIAGASPFKFVWENGSTVKDRLNVTDGSYKVKMISRLNTESEKEFVVKHLEMLSVEIKVFDAKPNQNGSINITPSGGVAPYQYAITPNVPLNNIPAGSYTLTVTDNNLCTTSVNFTVMLNVGTEKVENSIFQITPQPVENDLIILSNLQLPDEKWNVEIKNILGQSIKNSIYSVQNNRVAVSDLKSGYYFLILSRNQQRLILPFEKI